METIKNKTESGELTSLRSFKINTSKCRGELKLMKHIIAKNNWKEVFNEDAHVFWNGLDIPQEDYWRGVESCINRLPGMKLICHKKLTGYILNKFCEYYPERFNFFPRTFLIPEEYDQFIEHAQTKEHSYFVSKPTAGSQGDGIKLFKGGKCVNLDFLKYTSDEVVVQDYIANPLLLKGLKFDLRLYIFIASLNPFVAYLNDEGLARFCTEPYEMPNNENFRKSYSHLTNYSLNKLSKTYKYTEEVEEDHDGSKRTLCSFWKALEKEGIQKEKVWGQIKNFLPEMLEGIKIFLNFFSKCTFEKSANNKCFHIIGVDVLIDQNFKPWLLELNANPSLSIDHDKDHLFGKEGVTSPIDLYVKERAMGDALKYFSYKKEERKNLSRVGSYELIYSSENEVGIDVFSKVLECFSKLSGFAFRPELKAAAFNKLHSLIQIPEFKKLMKVDYDLLYQKTKMVVEGSMDIFGFIYALEELCKKCYGKREFLNDKLRIMENLTKNILEKYPLKKQLLIKSILFRQSINLASLQLNFRMQKFSCHHKNKIK